MHSTQQRASPLLSAAPEAAALALLSLHASRAAAQQGSPAMKSNQRARWGTLPLPRTFFHVGQAVG
jgi:hypothetical protein